MNRKLVSRLAGRGVYFLALLLAFPAPAPLSAQQQAGDRWAKAIEAFASEDAVHPHPKGGIVFTGSSTFERWNKNLQAAFPDYDVIPRGFGGSTIQDAVRHVDRTVIFNQPRQVVVYAGENDIAAGRTPRQVADGFAEFCGLVFAALPDTRILYVGIKPSPLRWNLQPKFTETDKLVAAYADGQDRVDFIEIAPALLDASGQLRPELFAADRLHINAEGYRILAGLITPHLIPAP